MPSSRPAQRFNDIKRHIEFIRQFTVGMSFGDFLADDRTRLAVERCLQIISEAATKLGADAEDLCPGLPWNDIRGFGNVLRHKYDAVVERVVWDTIGDDLDALYAACLQHVNAT